MKENKDYKIIPSSENIDEWNVRILTGNFTETVVKFGSISFNEVEEHLSFNFTIVSSPDIITEDDKNLQNVCGLILENIIEIGLEEGSVGMKDRDTGEIIE